MWVVFAQQSVQLVANIDWSFRLWFALVCSSCLFLMNNLHIHRNLFAYVDCWSLKYKFVFLTIMLWSWVFIQGKLVIFFQSWMYRHVGCFWEIYIWTEISCICRFFIALALVTIMDVWSCDFFHRKLALDINYYTITWKQLGSNWRGWFWLAQELFWEYNKNGMRFANQKLLSTLCKCKPWKFCGLTIRIKPKWRMCKTVKLNFHR